MNSSEQDLSSLSDMASGPYSASLPEIIPPADDANADAPDKQQPPVYFSNSKSQHLGFVGKTKDMFTGKKLVSTVMTLGFLFTWSERVLTYFRTGFSLYRDTPKMVTGKNLNDGRLEPVKATGSNIRKLFIPGSDNNFLTQYTRGEKLEALGTIGGAAQNLWFLFSSREGDIPEGDTLPQRLKSIFKDPKHHVAQLAGIWMTAVIGLVATGRVMSGIENLTKDGRGNRVGFNPGQALKGLDTIAKTEKLMPLIAGSILLISAPPSIYGLLSIKKPKSEDSVPANSAKTVLSEETSGNLAVSDENEHSHIKPFAKSESQTQTTGLKQMLTMLSPANIKDMAQYAAKHDPIGLTGRILGFALDIGSFGVGLARLKQIESGQYAHKFGAMNSPEWNKAYALAKQTRNVGILGFALTGLYSMYVYDTVMHAYKKELETMKAAKDVPQMAR